MKHRLTTLSIAALFVPYIAIIIGLEYCSNAWIAILLYHAGVILIISIDGHWDLIADLLHGWRLLPAVGAILLGGLGGMVLWLIWPWMDLAPVEKLATMGLKGGSWLGFAVYLCLVNPCLEEIYWRGHLARETSRPSLEDGVFAGYHVLVLAHFVAWPWVLLSFAALMGAAWTWRRLAKVDRGLLLPLLSHVVANTGVVVVLHVKSGMPIPFW
jgi:hypothetical protein